MAIPWTREIRRRRQLSVHPGAGMAGGAWTGIFADALREFNRLSARHNLGVTLVRSATRATARDGADVEIDAAAGQVTRRYEGTTITREIRGGAMHGRTLLVSRDGGIEKAFVFLPRNPQVNTPWGVRAVGPAVKKLIAVHELVHACGLEDDDHNHQDLFQASPQVDPGRRPADDRIRIQAGGRMQWMPPLVLAPSTVQLVRSVWAG